MTNEKVNSCKCCSKYVEEIKNLKNSLAKFSIGKNNLDVILGNQRCIFDKAGIGYKLEKQQKFLFFLTKIQFSFHYMFLLWKKRAWHIYMLF